MEYLAYTFISLLSAAAASFVTLKLLRRAAPPAHTHPAPEAPAPELPRPPFDLPASDAETLAGLLEGETPADAALVLAGLPAASAAALLAELQPDRRAAVLAAMAAPRPADPAELRAMRDELVRRLHGSLGGPAAAASHVAAMPYAARKLMLEKISALDPAAAAALRQRFVLEEDLMYIAPADAAAFCGAVAPAELGVLLTALPEGLGVKFREQLDEKAALAAHKAASGAPAMTREQAVAAVVDHVEKLCARGIMNKPPVRIKNPPPAPAPAEKDGW